MNNVKHVNYPFWVTRFGASEQCQRPTEEPHRENPPPAIIFNKLKLDLLNVTTYSHTEPSLLTANLIN